MLDKTAARLTGTLAFVLLLGVGQVSAQTQSYDNSRWVGGITNTSVDTTCRSFGAHRIGDGSGWQIAAEIRGERLEGLLTAKPGNNNRHKYRVSAYLGPGSRLERGTMLLGPYIAKFDGDIKGDQFEAEWVLNAVGEFDCNGKIFMNLVR